MSPFPRAVLITALTTLIIPTATLADEASAEAVLREAGLTRVFPSFILQGEFDANTLATQIGNLRGSLSTDLSRLSSLKREYESMFSEASRLRSEATKVTYEYNSQTKRQEEKRTTDDSKLREADRKSQAAESIRLRNRPKEQELERIISAAEWKIQGEQARYQTLVERTLYQYQRIAARPEIKAALRELNRGTRPKLALGPVAAYQQNVFNQSVELMAILGYRRESDLYWLSEDAEFIKQCEKAHLLWREVAMHERRLAPTGQADPPATKSAIRPIAAPSVPARPGTSHAALLTAAQVATRRADLVRGVRELRRRADALQARRDALLADGEARDSLDDINKASSKRRQAKIGTRPGMTKALQDLGAMERAIRPETIALKRDGDLLKADARLNGKPASMVVDPAAEWVKLPDRLAAELAVRPAPDARPVPVATGEGGTIQARRATIKSLQLGSFTAEGIDCLVLPPGAGDGPPVLGGPALDRVVAELDGGSATLTLTRVDPPPSATTATARPVTK